VGAPALLQGLLLHSASRTPQALALTDGAVSLSYAGLQLQVEQFASALMGLGLERGERVGIYLEKRSEAVVASFGSAAAGGVMVPINPLLKPEQVAFILRDCNVRLLLTSPPRHALLAGVLPTCHDLRHVLLTSAPQDGAAQTFAPAQAGLGRDAVALLHWSALAQFAPRAGHRVLDTDMAAILYTSGSTGSPKGVVLSHRNMVVGARSVASYLGNHAQDTLLAALPLSFDAGFSQLTTAFHVGARVVLLNYLLPHEVLKTLLREGITGLTAVPPLYIQLAQLDWPVQIGHTLRYFANTGGRLPQETLRALRQRAPGAKPYLMYGLTEAFRSTYLAPEEVERRPDSIGRAIPDAEILVLREDGTPCAVDEPGELVHRGALVGLGYWNDAERTAQRYKPLPAGVAGRPGAVGVRGVLGRHGAPGRARLFVFCGPARRDDQKQWLPHQPYRSRRGALRHPSGGRVHGFWRGAPDPGPGHPGDCHTGNTCNCRCRARDARAAAGGLPHPHAGLYGAGGHPSGGGPAAAQPQRQDRPRLTDTPMEAAAWPLSPSPRAACLCPAPCSRLCTTHPCASSVWPTASCWWATCP
jgi:acyl-CoA ligase (AMP-forming) (exosortase A-associated)